MAARAKKKGESSKSIKDKKADSKNEDQGLKGNSKMRIAFGLFILLTSIIFLISFTSFLITGNYDQTILNAGINELGETEVHNWLGKLGAILSQKFIGDWFGIAAFIFIPVLLRLGLKVLFKITIFSSKEVFKYSIFTLLWLPPFFSYLFTGDHLLFVGGGIGHVLSYYLIISIGSIGTFLLLSFIFVAFVLINFNVKLDELFSSKPNEDENALEEEKAFETTLETNRPVVIEEQINPIEPVEPITELTLEVDHPIEKTPEPSLDLITEDPIIEDTNEVPLSVEIPEPTADKVEPEIELETVVGKEDEVLDDKAIKNLASEFGEYDPTLDLSKYQKPSLDLLKDFGESGIEVNREELEANKNRIINTLKNYKIEISQISAVIGPTVTLYEIVPAPGVRISKIKNLEDDIALSLSALGIRIIAPIPGKGTIGIEVPNKNSEIVSMKALLASEKFQNTDMILPVALGKTISNESYIADLAKMPHLLMAGATGQGKSVGLNAILVSLLYKLHPSQLKFVLVDPKKVELTLYNKIERHYLAKLPDTDEAIITDTQKVVATLNSLCMEMDQRYELLKDAMTRNIKEYNEKFVARKLNPENGHRYLPYIVLVIDEFADLIMTAGKEVETPIARLAQLARAIGIHLIVATQRPSVNVITGIIKANFPSRLAFRVTSKIDSRTILDAGGADQLIGRGDLLYSPGNELIRLQCPFVDTPEVERICEFIGEQQGYSDAFLLPEYVGEASASQGSMEDEDRDVLFDDAALIVVQHQQGSASLLQRRLKLGYNRAGRIVDQLEAAGIIGPFSGSKARDVLIPDEMTLEQKLRGE